MKRKDHPLRVHQNRVPQLIWSVRGWPSRRLALRLLQARNPINQSSNTPTSTRSLLFKLTNFNNKNPFPLGYSPFG